MCSCSATCPAVVLPSISLTPGHLRNMKILVPCSSLETLGASLGSRGTTGGSPEDWPRSVSPGEGAPWLLLFLSSILTKSGNECTVPKQTQLLCLFLAALSCFQLLKLSFAYSGILKRIGTYGDPLLNATLIFRNR